MTETQTLTREDDAALVWRCLEGNAAAWETLIDRYRRLVFSVPVRLGLPPDDCADVFQGVSLALFKSLHTVRDLPRLSSWLITTTLRESQRVMRRRPRETSLDSPADDDRGPQLGVDHTLPDAERIRIEEQALIRRGIAQLPPRCQSLLKALYYERPTPSYREIQERLGIPAGGIGPTRARCLEKLRALLVRLGFR
ncbi:MAG: sigma-70 family RNA polymerase sigma factor [Planctomycetota bacterium]